MKYISPLDLGQMTDAEIAKKYKVTERTVRSRRAKFGIAPYRDIRVDWEEIDPIIFRYSVSKIARTFNLSRSSVEHRRNKIESKERECGKQ